MGRRIEQITRLMDLFLKRKVLKHSEIADYMDIGNRMIQLYLKDLQALRSYSHSGQFVTLPDTPTFNDQGIWFYQKIGFSKFGTSLATIVGLIEQSKVGLSREDLESTLKIRITQQIQVLMQREKLYRVKLGSRYLYIPEAAQKNKKNRIKLIGDRKTEEYFEKDVQSTDLVALLKAVLVEKNVSIEIKIIKHIAKKYSLQLPLQKIHRLLVKYDLPEKKTL